MTVGRIMFFIVWLMPIVAGANVASVGYVNETVANRVDTAASATQTMAGSYTVSGTLVVPTPPLPSAQ